MRSLGGALAKALLVLGGVVSAVAIAEAFLRLADYTYKPLRIEVVNQWSEWRYYFVLENRQFGFQDRQFVYDPLLIWRPKKGGLFANEQGYRGREIPVAKEPGAVRIFAIGDSNTAGWPGEDAPNWPMYLEQRVRKVSDRVAVVNAGVWGYSSFQGVRRLKEVLRFQPDMVLISFGANDAMRVTVSDVQFTSKNVRKMNIDLALMKHRVGQLVLALIDGLGSGTRDVLVPRVSVEEYKTNLKEMIRLSKERDVIAVLLTRPFTGPSPSTWWWKNYAPAYNDATIRVGYEESVPVIDIAGHFEDKKELFVDESHFTPEGLRAMAEVIHGGIGPLLP